jgi:hypothetical protein
VTARDDILNAVRGGAAAGVELPKVPDFCSAPADLVDLFAAALARLDGKAIAQPLPASSIGYLRRFSTRTASIRRSAK